MGRYYSIENDRFIISICQSWAFVLLLSGYIIQLFFFYPQNYISFERQRITFPDQRKYFGFKRITFEMKIL